MHPLQGRRRGVVGSAIILSILACLLTMSAGCPQADPPDTTPIPGGGAWRSFARVPVPLHESGGVVYDGKLYMIGGRLESGPVSTLYRYDPAADAWTQLASHPGTPVDHMNVAEVDGILYAIGGTIEWPGPSVSAVYAYDPATNAWRQRAGAPRPIAVSGTGVVNGRIYVIGGLSGSQAASSVMEYDPAGDTWTDLTAVSPLPTPRDHFMAGVIDGRIYCPGGRQVSIDAIVNVHEVFDPATRTWTTAALPPTPRAGFVGVVLGREFLVIGGEGANTAGGVFSQNEAYDPIADGWRTLSPMRIPRHATQGGVIGGVVYVPAGSPVIGRTFTDVHEGFSLDFE